MVLLVASVGAANLAVAIPTNRSGKGKEKHIHQVVVDVVVTDTGNQPVRGLREQDFQVFENKKRQQILSFEAHEDRAGTASPDPPKLPENTFSNAFASETGTINVILLDEVNTTIEDQVLARQELIAYGGPSA